MQLSAVESIIQQFHAIDNSGQTFRYTKDKNGESTLRKLPKFVDLKHFQEVSEKTFNFFEGCESGLNDLFQFYGDF
jgi:hypothetical protein